MARIFKVYVAKIDETIDVDFDAFEPHIQEHIIDYGLKQKYGDAAASVPTKDLTGKALAEARKAARIEVIDTHNDLMRGIIGKTRTADKTEARALVIARGQVKKDADFKRWVSEHRLKTASDEYKAEYNRLVELAAKLPAIVELAKAQLEAEAKLSVPASVVAKSEAA